MAFKTQDDLLGEIRAALSSELAESLDAILGDLRDELRGVQKERDDLEDELEGDATVAHLEEVLQAVHEWFDRVLTLGKPMTDPRSIARKVEEAIRG